VVDERRWPGLAEPGDSRAEDARLDDMVAPASLRRAVPHRHAQLHARDDRALGPEPPDVSVQPAPGLAARLIDDIGPPGDLAITRPPAGLPRGLPVVMARPDRDAEHDPDRHPARHDQLGEILPRQVRSEWRGLRARRTIPYPDRGAERRELLPAEQKRPPRHPKRHYSIPAELGALRRHPLHRRPPGLIHGPYQRPQRPVIVSLTALTNAFRLVAGGRNLRRVLRRCRDPRTAVPVAVRDPEDGRTEHLANRFEANAADRGELSRGQRRPPRPAGPHSRHPGLSRSRQFFAHHSVIPRRSICGRRVGFDRAKLLEKIMEKLPSSFD
jgi:hypothetical protein